MKLSKVSLTVLQLLCVVCACYAVIEYAAYNIAVAVVFVLFVSAARRRPRNNVNIL